MERRIGEIFEYNDEWYQCVEDKYSRCINCCFYNGGHKLCMDEDIGACVKEYRSDAKSICFKKLEKVGEPYTNGCKLFQRYKLFIPTNELVNLEIKQNKEDMEEYKMYDAKEDIPEFDKVVDECLFGKQKLKLKPFDLQKAKEGKPVCTRDGRSVRILCFDAKRRDEKNIIALVPSKCYPGFEDLIAYPDNGIYYGEPENDKNLMMIPEKRSGWIVIHKEAIYDKETAEKIAKETTADVIRIQKIEWKE